MQVMEDKFMDTKGRSLENKGLGTTGIEEKADLGTSHDNCQDYHSN